MLNKKINPITLVPTEILLSELRLARVCEEDSPWGYEALKAE